MDETISDLLRSADKSPTYWMQVALLEFLQSLDAMRESRGEISKKELANRVGVSPATLSRWLNGNENITVSTMCRLATALDAAVHIHVADNKEKGRWQPELGMARAESRHRDATESADVGQERRTRRRQSGRELRTDSAVIVNIQDHARWRGASVSAVPSRSNTIDWPLYLPSKASKNG